MSGRKKTLVSGLGWEARKYKWNIETLPGEILVVKERSKIKFEGKEFLLSGFVSFQSCISTDSFHSQDNFSR